MVWRIDGPQCNESAKVKWELVEYTNGRGLDLGCGPFKTFPHFIGVDNGKERWGTQGTDVVVSTCEDLSIFADKSMDFVFSSHLLEHLEDPKKALKEWTRVIKDGGYLCLYLPHEDLYPKVGDPGANPDHKHNLSESIVERWMIAAGPWDLVRCEQRNEGIEYSFLMVFKIGGKGLRYSHKNPKPEKTVAVCRYGAFGDAIQASSVLPGLKKQGYYVTFYTTNIGYEILKHDPHVDKFVVQGKDQVPNEQLPEFWDYLKTKHTKVINLSESVEATWLAIPGRTAHTWPVSVRRKYMNRNYVEFAHDLAEVEFKPVPKFYPSKEESEWAVKQKAAYGKCVLWSLAGSSVHKTWPYLDHVIAAIMTEMPEMKVILVGDAKCQILEQGWENEPRVIRKSGVWTIRQSLAFAQVADIVVGPETGVLNAVSHEQVPKVITLSHSSVENLTRDWVNTVSLTPKNTSCYPCHSMHYSWEFCREDKESGCAACQVDISPDRVYDAIKGFMEPAKWQPQAA
jgi:ADP-heptose:LPS heptosyltransferase/predicted SAM-dependent methyltransferase